MRTTDPGTIDLGSAILGGGCSSGTGSAVRWRPLGTSATLHRAASLARWPVPTTVALRSDDGLTQEIEPRSNSTRTE
jgi:hypothetical protein